MRVTWVITTLDKGIAISGFAEGADGNIAIIRSLEKKFGPLGRLARERVGSWPAERLDDLHDALDNARSLDELGLEDCTPTVIITQRETVNVAYFSLLLDGF